MEKEMIESVESIRKKFDSPRNANAVHKKGLTPLERAGLFVTERVGTMGFFFIIFGWTVFWLSWNIFGPKNLRFDPAPAFVLWLFISNMIQLHLMPLIMVGQNIQGKHAELRAAYDYETDKKAEREIETILLRLEKQEELLQEILKRIEKLESRK